MRIKKAVKTLTSALKKDSDFFYAYQSNIAVAFMDEFTRSKKRYKSGEDIHGIANRAAVNFLNSWINQ